MDQQFNSGSLLGSEDEARYSGRISSTDFGLYMSAFGTWATNLFLFCLLILLAVFSVLGPLWLTHWANMNDDSKPGHTRVFYSLDMQPSGSSVMATSAPFFRVINDLGSHPAASFRESARSLLEANGEDMSTEKPNQFYFLAIYIAINFLSAAFAAMQTLIMTICSLRASRTIHSLMLTRLWHAPMSFFDVTPTGRILNRFLQDMQNVDNYVPTVIIQQVQFTLTMITQMVLIFIYCPAVFFLIPFIVVPYFFIFRKVRSPARDTRRIESIAHSPVYSEYVDCLRGLDTIRAMAKEDAFIKSNLKKVEQMAKGRYWNEAVGKWAQSVTTLLGCVLYLFVGLTGSFYYYIRAPTALESNHFVSYVMQYFGSNIDTEGTTGNGVGSNTSRPFLSSAEFGLVLMYAGILQRSLMDYCMGLTNLEQNFVSVERCAEFCRLPHEAGEEIIDGESQRPVDETEGQAPRPDNGETPPTDFKDRGDSLLNDAKELSGLTSTQSQDSNEKEVVDSPNYREPDQPNGSVVSDAPFEKKRTQSPSVVALEVRNLGLRYRLHKSPALQAVNFQIQHGEKVAILGRTGSGKSSLFNALSGLYPCQSGSSIFMNGQKLGKDCGPVRWRSEKFRMVAQDSLLMSGSIRENLVGATAKQITDERIWHVLQIVGLDAKVISLGGLEFRITASGDNLSAGEKQLFAVARALIEQPRILLCDEATANIDLAADESLHNLILEDPIMETVTVLWIMHRLHFIDKFDKVMIFEQSRLVEIGTPAELKSDPKSRLTLLLAEADLSAAQPEHAGQS